MAPTPTTKCRFAPGMPAYKQIRLSAASSIHGEHSQRGRRDILSMDGLTPKFREEYEPLSQADPGHELQRQDLRRKLQEALAQLPAAQQQTFVLHAEGELSYREVADTLGISIGTVMSRLYYARHKLRTLLDEWMRSP